MYEFSYTVPYEVTEFVEPVRQGLQKVRIVGKFNVYKDIQPTLHLEFNGTLKWNGAFYEV